MSIFSSCSESSGLSFVDAFECTRLSLWVFVHVFGLILAEHMCKCVWACRAWARRWKVVITIHSANDGRVKMQDGWGGRDLVQKRQDVL